MATPESIFSEARNSHLRLLQTKIDRLKEFRMEEFQHWVLNFEDIKNNQQEKSWLNIPELNFLHSRKIYPAVYYFSSENVCDFDFYTSFRNAKSDSLNERRQGKTGKQTYNISHVPKYKETRCIYAGSVLTNLYGRLISHLGGGNPGTSALYLSQIVEPLSVKPKVTLHYQLLELKYIPVVEVLERIVQDTLNPLIGRKSLSRMDKELIHSQEQQVE
ncbi:hypothetical protein JMG10_28170 [Nostoc ellipsosporum NOK]|nr:hypothetical protein [Nostoc ellipsosporum NOK]